MFNSLGKKIRFRSKKTARHERNSGRYYVQDHPGKEHSVKLTLRDEKDKQQHPIKQCDPGKSVG